MRDLTPTVLRGYVSSRVEESTIVADEDVLFTADAMSQLTSLEIEVSLEFK